MTSINNKKIILGTALVALIFIVFGAGFVLGKNQVVCKACKPEQIDFSLFWDAYNKLSENFIDSSKINDREIIYGAISGMTKSTGDAYTNFFDPKTAKTFQEELSGSFEGIGAEVGIKKSQLIIIAPLKDTPAEKAGIKAGDQIIKIDGRSAFDMSVDEAVSIIRGKRGTKVVLTILREGWNQPREIEIIRETIKIKSVEWELKEGALAYIKIYHFDQSLAYDFNKVAYEVLSSGANKIILDLRNNPGGYLEVGNDIAGWFLKKGAVVTIEDFGGKIERKEYKANGNSAFSNYPTVLLINEGTASASEILAGALRDDRGIKLVGEKSFGKGSVQELVPLQDGESFLKITIANWLTPKGSSISEVGLAPDYKIELKEGDLEKNKDPQLEKALEIVRNMN
ncbi:MAG: S41 family peptidase [Patescibacteria group bacterium]